MQTATARNVRVSPSNTPARFLFNIVLDLEYAIRQAISEREQDLCITIFKCFFLFFSTI